MRLFLVISLGTACLWGLAVSAENIAVRHPGGIYTLNQLSLAGDTVCSVKAKIAQKLDMKADSFDLQYKYQTMDGGKSLKDAGLSNGNAVSVTPVRRSRQC